jgi:REP element-mobilizing transposase RayT
MKQTKQLLTKTLIGKKRVFLNKRICAREICKNKIPPLPTPPSELSVKKIVLQILGHVWSPSLCSQESKNL